VLSDFRETRPDGWASIHCMFSKPSSKNTAQLKVLGDFRETRPECWASIHGAFCRVASATAEPSIPVATKTDVGLFGSEVTQMDAPLAAAAGLSAPQLPERGGMPVVEIIKPKGDFDEIEDQLAKIGNEQSMKSLPEMPATAHQLSVFEEYRRPQEATASSSQPKPQEVVPRAIQSPKPQETPSSSFFPTDLALPIATVSANAQDLVSYRSGSPSARRRKSAEAGLVAHNESKLKRPRVGDKKKAMRTLDKEVAKALEDVRQHAKTEITVLSNQVEAAKSDISALHKSVKDEISGIRQNARQAQTDMAELREQAMMIKALLTGL